MSLARKVTRARAVRRCCSQRSRCSWLADQALPRVLNSYYLTILARILIACWPP